MICLLVQGFMLIFILCMFCAMIFKRYNQDGIFVDQNSDIDDD